MPERFFLASLGIEETHHKRGGVAYAPSAIRNNLDMIEDYSPQFKRNIPYYKDVGELKKEELKEFLNKVYNNDAKFLILGGEHTVSFYIISELSKFRRDFIFLSLDAHLDLREEYQGTKLNHATVIRRIYELLGKNRVYVYGIRSGDKEEFEYAKIENILIESEEDLISIIEDRMIYLSLDLDILDPSIAPGVTAPEPGGLDFNSLTKLIYKIGDKASSIIGVDMVELTPNYDASGITSIVAAKLTRELILTSFAKK